MVGGTSVPQHIWRRARGPLALAPGSRAVLPGGLARAPCFNPAPARGARSGKLGPIVDWAPGHWPKFPSVVQASA